MATVLDLPPSAKMRVGQGSNFNLALDAGGLKQRITWKCLWEEYPAFLEAVIGPLEQIGGVTRRVPLRNPFFPSLYCVAISGVKGFGADSAISASRPFTWVDLTLEFEQPSWDPSSDSPFVTLTHQGSSRSVTVPGQQYAFSAGTYSGQKIQQDIGVAIGGVAIGVTLHQLPDLNAFLSVAMPLVGKVNSAALTVAGITYAAGTVYFETFQTQSSKTALGTAQHEASISLIWSAMDWNKFLDPGGTATAVTPAPFGTSDLNSMII
jgi:hypothetical protein